MNGKIINNLNCQKYRDFPLSIKIILIIYIIGFGVGTITHTIDIVKGGFLPYVSAPDWKNIYWTSLILLDFIAILLILKYTISGLILANLIMISDIVINTNLLTYSSDYRIILQIFFGLFILMTTPLIIKKMIKYHKATCTKLTV
jgi:hypothetical protein